GQQTYYYQAQGPRGMDVLFTAFADTHETALGMMATWQSLLGTARVREQLRASGIASWTMANVEDKSALLDTGYQGRAAMTVTFGVVACIASEPSTQGVVDTATIQGNTNPGGIIATNDISGE